MEIGAAVRELSGPARGWRAWVVTETPVGPRLASVLHDLIWPASVRVLASCRRDEDPFADPLPAHPVPGASCNCGFHAARDPADALSYLRGRDEAGTVCRILGEVWLWGHVLETESGWRASHAAPARLYVPGAALAAELAVYGVPISSRECGSLAVTSSKAASAGLPTSSWSVAPMLSSKAVASG
jgi:hypothetical protein